MNELSRTERRRLRKITSRQEKAQREVQSLKSKIWMRVFWVVAVLILTSIALWAYSAFKVDPHEFDNLAKCLSEKGVVMYGAYWCPHCQEQKKMFRDSFTFIKYIECASVEDPHEMTEECKAAKIEGYPMWIFPGDVRLGGEQTPEKLAKISDCPLK